jgi:predicted outer membrane repeat protein
VEGTYTAGDGDSEIVIDKSITLNGNGATLNANGKCRAFSITGGSPTISGFTITGGNAAGYGGGMNITTGTVTVTNCVFDNNTSNSYGGGIYAATGTSVTIRQCTFKNNVSTAATLYSEGAGRGAGVYVDSSSVSLTNCTFIKNNAGGSGSGGAVYSDGSSPTITYCAFVNNKASTGAEIYANSSVTVTNSLIWNAAYNDTTAIGYNDSDASLKVTLDHCAVASTLPFGTQIVDNDSSCVTISTWTPGEPTEDKTTGVPHKVFKIENHLAALSGLVGKASGSPEPNVDQLGNARDTMPDIGAVEFTGNPTLTASATAVSATYGIATFDPASITFTVSPDKLAYTWYVDGNSTSTKGGITAKLSDGTTANSKTLTFSGAPMSEGEQEFKVKAEYTTGDNTTKKIC